jgi:CubicO group peptidase (beta-lactamase class C family)
MTTAAEPVVTNGLEIDLEPALAVMSSYVADGTIPCGALGVVDAAGRSGYRFVAGSERAIDERTVFFLASITKAIVATAVMRYVDEERLDLHTPMGRYLPEFEGSAAADVSAWQVLTHTSGLPDMPVESLRHERPTYRRSLQFVRESTLLAQPGETYAYNSVTFILLAEAMARLSGVSFGEALASRLTEPLAMTDTTFDARPVRDRVPPVHGFGIDNRLVQELLLRFLAVAQLPGGGMFGTLADLLRFGRALLPPDPAAPGPRVLSQEAIDEMTRNHTEGMRQVSEDGLEHEVHQALGWRKPQPGWPGSERAFTHGGITGGRVWVDPDAGLAVVFLSNLWQAPLEVSVAVIEAVYKAQVSG